MIDKQLIHEIVEREIEGTSMYLVDILVRSGNIIVVEIDNDEGVAIDDCIALSRKIESHFDREVEDFELEVGSAGLTSPLKIPRQYAKNIGNEVEVLTKDGRKILATLTACDDESFVILTSRKEKPKGEKRPVIVEEELRFLYDDVKYTKYLIRIK